jgi:hypothetical protein
MSSTLGNVASPLGQFLISHSTVSTAVSHEVNVTGTAPTLYDVSGTVGGTAAAYLKISEANAAGNGVDQNIPEFKLYFPAGETTSYIIGTGVPVATGLTFWVTTTQASGSTQSAPADTVNLKIVAQ